MFGADIPPGGQADVVLLEGDETAKEALWMLVVGAEAEVAAAAWYLSSGSMEKESAGPLL